MNHWLSLQQETTRENWPHVDECERVIRSVVGNFWLETPTRLQVTVDGKLRVHCVLVNIHMATLGGLVSSHLFPVDLPTGNGG